jgi:hypothetical protein
MKSILPVAACVCTVFASSVGAGTLDSAIETQQVLDRAKRQTADWRKETQEKIRDLKDQIDKVAENGRRVREAADKAVNEKPAEFLVGKTGTDFVDQIGSNKKGQLGEKLRKAEKELKAIDFLDQNIENARRDQQKQQAEQQAKAKDALEQAKAANARQDARREAERKAAEAARKAAEAQQKAERERNDRSRSDIERATSPERARDKGSWNDAPRDARERASTKA